ncbi:MAG: prolipoprotein diacylglyceryl transferase, partial [Leptospiraceae bacterium]|nr:prolipoprotein diacylglyceryl transferase [Leptospiraceae bacterium]
QILGQPGLSTYSIMLMIAFLTASFLAPRELRRRGLRPEVADWGLLIAVIGAIVGSKVFYILEIWGRIWIIDLSWWDTFKEVFFSWDGMADRIPGAMGMWSSLFDPGGLVFYGGFIFAFGGIYFYLRYLGVEIWRYGDAFMPSLAIGYAIGRLGCLISGDGCFGHAASANIPLLTMVYGPENGICNSDPSLAYQHPYVCSMGVNVWNTPLMESLLSTGLFIAYMAWLRHKNFRPGMLVAIFLIFNGVARFSVEFLRLNDAIIPILDAPVHMTEYGIPRAVSEYRRGGTQPLAEFFQYWHWYGFTQAQITAFFLIAIGSAWMVIGKLWKRDTAAET